MLHVVENIAVTQSLKVIRIYAVHSFVELSDRSAMLVMVETIFEKPRRNRIRMALFVGTVE